MVSATSGDGLTLESLPEIHLSELSQSELHALSLCSKSAFQHHNNNDLITPHLNPSIFNKSAGARRQTYSRPYRRRRLSPKPLNSGAVAPASSTEAENKAILGYLKNLLGDQEEEFTNPEKVIESNLGAVVVYDCNKKRKRGSRSKMNGLKDENGVEVELLNVNSNGVVVNFQELGDSDAYYSEELKKRTEGLGTEEEGLGFLRGLNGKWCSRRNKRKFVDACEFGDKFPVGWKILLGLRRRNGCVSVYCRRYVSPAGEHFTSCKEASLHLQSYFKDRANQKIDQMAATVQQVGNVASGTHAGVSEKESDMQENALPILSTNNEELDFLSMDNLFEVQIRVIFDCSKCKLTFEHKSKYLRHLFEVHQNTTRTYRLDKFVGGGSIIDDEKCKRQKKKSTYEAQVGTNLKNNTKNSKELPVQITDQKSSESPSGNELPSRTCLLDALAEIAHNSMLENTEDGPIEKPRICSSPNNLNMEISATNSDHEESLGDHLTGTGTGMAASDLAPNFKLCNDGHITTDENIMSIDGISDIGNGNVVCTSTLDHPKPDEVKKNRSSELKVICRVNHVNPNELLAGEIMQIKEKFPQMGVADSSILSVQSLHCRPAFDPISNKEESGVLSADQLIDNVSGFEELRFDKIEPLNYCSVNGPQSVSLPEVFMELSNDAGKVEVEPETVVLNNGRHAGIVGQQSLSSAEVSIEFPNDAGKVEVEPETVVLNNGGDAGIDGQQSVSLPEVSTELPCIDDQQSVSLPEVSMELPNDAGTMEVEPETVVLNNGGDAGIDGQQSVSLPEVSTELPCIDCQQSVSLPEVSTELPNDAGTMEVEPETVALNNGGDAGIDGQQSVSLPEVSTELPCIDCQQSVSLPEVSTELPNDAGTMVVEPETVVLNNGGDAGIDGQQSVSLPEVSTELPCIDGQQSLSLPEVSIEFPNDAGRVEDEPETVVLNIGGDAGIDGQQSVSLLPEVSMELLNDAGMVEVEPETVVLNNGGNAGIEVEPEIVALHNNRDVEMEDVEPDSALNNSVVCLITSVCVWCAKKFTREAVESEDQSESVGFMCPTCKATISKHLDNGFHHF